MLIKDKAFIVTGGSSGLGAATVRLLHARGGKVARKQILDMDETLGKKFQQEFDSRVTFFKCHSILDEIHSIFGEINGIICCAGISLAESTITSKGSASIEKFKRVLDINITGSYIVSSYGAFLMSKQKVCEESGERGVIIMVSSVAAFEGQRGQTGYAATKGAISSISLPLARDLARYNIRSVSIAPGVFASPMTDAFPDKVRDALLADIPLRRFGKSSEFAHTVEFCITNAYVNGTTLRLDGGVRMSSL